MQVSHLANFGLENDDIVAETPIRGKLIDRYQYYNLARPNAVI